MKKFLLFFGVILTLGIVLAGFNNIGQQNATKDKVSESQSEQTSNVRGMHEDGNKEEILRGTNEVIATLTELKQVTKMQENNINKVNQLGKEIEQKWDRIEKKVEEAYPQDYENIEKSLYPLIAIAKKETPDEKKLHDLSIETLEKLENFKQKLQ